MYRGKRANKSKFYITLMATLAILCVTVVGTIAFIADESDDVVNTFTLSKVTTSVVEDIETAPGVKQNVKIQNTGDTEAYIRAAVVVTWQDAYGNVYGQKPVNDIDYNIEFKTEYETSDKWTLENDGFWYWGKEVAPNGLTDVLITSCSPIAGRVPEGFNLAVEIIGSGIQSRPDNVVDVWDNDKVDVTGNNGTLTVTQKS